MCEKFWQFESIMYCHVEAWESVIPFSLCNRRFFPSVSSSEVLRVKVHRAKTTWYIRPVEISNVRDSRATGPCKMRGAAFPQGGPEINYRSPEAADWLPGNDNTPDGRTVKLSSFDSHIINL